jgi:(2R)-sulfolactate sulfo-lyase subunit alpha
MSHPHMLAHDPSDNVAVVVVENLKAGTQMRGEYTSADGEFSVESLSDIPIGHKVAVKDIKKGDTAIKYGEDIGVFTADVAKGGYVHVHNLKTKRW